MQPAGFVSLAHADRPRYGRDRLTGPQQVCNFFTVCAATLSPPGTAVWPSLGLVIDEKLDTVFNALGIVKIRAFQQSAYCFRSGQRARLFPGLIGPAAVSVDMTLDPPEMQLNEIVNAASGLAAKFFRRTECHSVPRQRRPPVSESCKVVQGFPVLRASSARASAARVSPVRLAAAINCG